MAAALLTFCLVASACQTTKRSVTAIRPDQTNPDRFVCELAGTRPTVPPEYVIDWARVTSVPQAKAEHDKFVAVLRVREGIVAGYIIQLEGKNFICFNNMTWQTEFYAGLPSNDR